MVRLVGYFTIQANVLVAITAFTQPRRPDRDGAGWRVLRVAAVVGITTTGIVHWFFLRPLLDLAGRSYLCDKLLHVVVPLLAVVGWLLFAAAARPAARLAARPGLAGGLAGLHPGPRGGDRVLPVPVPERRGAGSASVVVTSLVVTALFVLVSSLLWLGNRRLPVRSPR